MIFEWFIFQPLTIENFATHFPGVAPVTVAQCFTWWDQRYQSHSKFFYRFQYRWHVILEFRQFSRDYSLGLSHPNELEEFDFDSSYSQLWKEWKESSYQLQLHYEAIEPLTREPRLVEGKTAAEVLRERLDRLESGWDYHQEQKIKGAWFDLNNPIPSIEEVQVLRELPYADYLQTRHWRQIRAALTLTEFAHCKQCDESFYSDDFGTGLHVHHIHYRNRGCERYEDLELLCSVHHARTHEREPNP